MNSVKKRIKLLFIMLLSMLTLSCGCGGFIRGFGPPTFFPVNVELPINLSKAGNTAETEFRVFLSDQYRLRLNFFHETDHDVSNYKQLFKFLSGSEKWGSGGAGQMIPLKLVITKRSWQREEIVIEKEYLTKGISGVGHDYIIRPLTILTLEPGKYSIRIEAKEDIPELSDVPVVLILCYWRV